MKFKINDQVIITIGKDKGKKSTISKVLPKENKVIVKGVNLYTKHVKAVPMMNRPGEKTVLERPLATGKIAILNDKGEPDRIGLRLKKDGTKERFFKKTGAVIKDKVLDLGKKVKKADTQKTKKATKTNKK